jgi:hypothetical protein
MASFLLKLGGFDVDELSRRTSYHRSVQQRLTEDPIFVAIMRGAIGDGAVVTM